MTMQDSLVETETPRSVHNQLQALMLVSVLGLVAVGLTCLFPPWLSVRCQRQQVLYWSEPRGVLGSSFAGFDFVLAPQKWSAVKTPANPPSGELYESQEYRIFWIMLAGEWCAVMLAATVGFYWLSSRPTRIHSLKKPAR